MTDWLTWEGLRALATVEVLTPETTRIICAAPDPARPILKKPAQRVWFDRAVPKPIEPGDIVFARTAWRTPWRDVLKPALTANVVLVSAFGDPMIRTHATDALLDDASPIRHWFGVQAMTTHPRLTAMPVGIEGSMVPVLEATAQATTRDVWLYVNFNVHRTFMGVAAMRADLWPAFATQPWVTAEQSVSPAQYAQQLGRSRFVLSPPGMGWDCYRTYEAIAMGAIPVVKRQPPCSDHLEALPVLLVDDWAEVTRERLQREWETRVPMSTRTMTMSYWRTRIEAAAQEYRNGSHQ